MSAGVGTATPRGQWVGPRRGPATRSSPRRVVVAVSTVGVIAIAANYSLRTLVEGLHYDTPLADLGLVPVISLGLAIWGRRGDNSELAIRDRSVDFLVAVPSLAVASVILIALPGPTSSLFWSLRLDLLALPLLAIGIVALVWGTQMVWRQRRALLFLGAAWPIPYTHVLAGVLLWLQATTTSMVIALLHVLPIAGHVRADPGSVIAIGSGPRAFTVAVATACSGAEGIVGFVLVGGAAAMVLRGRRSAKAAWLGLGAVLAFTANVWRLWLVLTVGARLGERVALDLLHPWIGAATLGAVGVAAALVATRFGLAVPDRSDSPPRTQRPLVGWLVAVLPLVAVLAVVDGRLSVYRPVIGDLGQARLESIASSPPTVAGWVMSSSQQVTWAARFFGSGSLWDRQLYVVTRPGLEPTVVTADAVSTGDPGRFAAYSVADCFNFHGDPVLHHHRPTLGHGITAEEIVYREHTSSRVWLSLSWIWPVVANGPRYERISLVTALPDATAAGLTPVEASLLGFARDVTAERIASAGGGTTTSGAA